MRLHVGCAMWTHRAWPQPRGSGERLRAYAGWCNAVEGNTTFYATPTKATTASWARQTDPDFRFVIKLPRAITHDRRLTGIEEQLRIFLDAIEPLGPRIHALWVQLPRSFAPVDVPALSGFLQRLPGSHRVAVEVRHRAFFDDSQSMQILEGVLEQAHAEWIPFDTTALFSSPPTSDAERAAWAKKPRMPRRCLALTGHPIVRYLGRDATEQTIEGWQHWIGIVSAWLREGRSPTVFIHTPDDADAPMLARRFHDEVRAHVPELEPLPEPERNEPLTLF